MTDRIRYFHTRNPRIIVFALTCEVKPLSLPDLKYTQRVSPDDVWAHDKLAGNAAPSGRPQLQPVPASGTTLARAELQRASDERNLLVKINHLWDIGGIQEITARRDEVGIKIGSAYDFDEATLQAVKAALMKGFFRLSADVAFECGDAKR